VGQDLDPKGGTSFDREILLTDETKAGLDDRTNQCRVFDFF
jgi:hypothetical protein